MKPANTPKPPYYAAIFTSVQAEVDGYHDMANAMSELAKEQEGFLGIESVRGADGFGITISYWERVEDIQNWKNNAQHQVAQKLGKEKWYGQFKTRICRVEREVDSRPSSTI